MTRVDDALGTFAGGSNCSQAVLGAFGPDVGLDRDACLRVARGFGGGMGRLGETCGAVTGAVMVLGLRQAGTLDPEQAKEESYEQVRAFFERFRAQHGSTVCRDLIGCDLSTPAGLAHARATGLFTTRCPTFVHSAVEILEALHGPVWTYRRRGPIEDDSAGG